uniref:PDZ domain-containing protein n=2 Tax=Guillardia theta TaxID=55529 RepID=A0A7S4KQ54_GUITH|mmetsp:Transcript_28725/g.92677  ORF Transcript_28725/g.92677 Transcript_28725/m.92677 type:complete len:151 (+) Transcript_28725:43-495(+)
MTKQDSVIISAPPLPDSQGYIAGVRMGDKVLFINHVDMRGKTSADAMRAVEDTGDREVELVVSEKEEKGPEMVKSFRLRKKKSSKSSLSYELIAASNQKKVGYIRLKEFDGRSGGDMADALKHLSSSDLLLLDLRGNPVISLLTPSMVAG